MALRDWKKDKENEWLDKRYGDKIYVAKHINYYSFLYINSLHPFLNYEKKFKTKSQALKFAKSYMRTH